MIWRFVALPLIAVLVLCVLVYLIRDNTRPFGKPANVVLSGENPSAQPVVRGVTAKAVSPSRPIAAVPASVADAETTPAHAAVGDGSEESAVDYDSLIAQATEDLTSHPENLGAALRRLAEETDPKMVIVTWRAISACPSASADDVTTAALYLLADDMREKRFAAVSLLCALSTVKPEVFQTVSELAQKDSDLTIRLDALSVLGEWLAKQPQYTEQIGEVFIPLMSTSTDAKLRTATLQFLGQPGVALDENMTAAVFDCLIGEPEATNRRLAAMALGTVRDPAVQPIVCEQLQAAYRMEFDPEARKEILAQLVYMSGADALSFLKEAASLEADEAIGQDIREFTQIISGGVTSPFEIRRGKEQLDSLKYQQSN